MSTPREGCPVIQQKQEDGHYVQFCDGQERWWVSKNRPGREGLDGRWGPWTPAVTHCSIYLDILEAGTRPPSTAPGPAVPEVLSDGPEAA